MIQYAIDLALSCQLFQRVIVSTDSVEIQEVAERSGAEAPFLRPAELAGDHTPTASVLAHALETLDDGNSFDYACCIYPAVPFTTPEDILDGLSLVREDGVGSAFAVTPFAAPIWRAFKKSSDSTLTMIWPENRNVRTQDLPVSFHDVGQFYWVPVRTFLHAPLLLTATSRGVEFPRWRAHDIDTEDDWIRAELIFLSLRKEMIT